jgi:hypothetical protein
MWISRRVRRWAASDAGSVELQTAFAVIISVEEPARPQSITTCAGTRHDAKREERDD